MTIKLTDEHRATICFFAGLVRGWASRLEDMSITQKKLKDDMMAESQRLAKLAGVKGL